MSKGQKAPQKVNKASEKAGLTLNVVSIKKYIKQYYVQQGIEYSKVSGGNIAMASMLETMVKIIIDKCEKEVAFNKSGLREITREGMNSALLRNSGEYGYFIMKANDFNDKFDYSKFLPIEKEMEKIYAEGKNSSFSIEAKNYMYYLLYTMFTNIAVTCSKLLSFSKNKTVNGNCVVHAADIEFPKSISVILLKNINESLKLHGQNLDGKEDDEEDETEVEDETEEQTEEKTTKAGTKQKTQTKSQKKETKSTTKTEVKASSPKTGTTTTKQTTPEVTKKQSVNNKSKKLLEVEEVEEEVEEEEEEEEEEEDLDPEEDEEPEEEVEEEVEVKQTKKLSKNSSTSNKTKK